MTDGKVSVKVEELKREYPNEWLLLAVEKRDALGMPAEGRLLAHGRDAEALWDKIATKQGQFCVFYTGEILKDTAVIFLA